MELRTLAPNRSASFTTALPPGTPAGDYRFTTGVEAGERRVVRSNIVRVTP